MLCQIIKKEIEMMFVHYAQSLEEVTPQNLFSFIGSPLCCSISLRKNTSLPLQQ